MIRLSRSLTRFRRYARAWRQHQRRPAMPIPYRLAIARLYLAAILAAGALGWALARLILGDVLGALFVAGIGALAVSGVAGTLIAGPPR